MRLTGQRGTILLPLIIAMLMMTVLGIGIYSLSTSSSFSEILANNNDNAYELARAGLRYGIDYTNSGSNYNYSATFQMPDADHIIKVLVDNSGNITSTGIVNSGSVWEAKRVLAFTRPPWAPPPGNGGIGQTGLTNPNTGGNNPAGAIQVNGSSIVLGGGVNNSYGSVWYQGSSIVGYCSNGACSFGSGLNVYFEFAFSNEDSSGGSTTYGDGFTFAVISAINNTRDRTGGADPQTSMGELIGYAGPGNTVDMLGLKPPKMGLQFDTFPNTGSGDICVAGNRQDPSPFANNVSLMFWGVRTISGYCDSIYPKSSFDDNVHNGGGLSDVPLDPLNAGGPGDAGYYQFPGPGSGYTCKSSGNTCNWMEDGYKYSARVEIVRHPSGTPNVYQIKAWILRLDLSGFTAMQTSHFKNVTVPFSDSAPQINKTVTLSAQDDNDFRKIFFGFTEATGGATQQVIITNTNAFFPQGSCSYSVSPASAAYGAAGGSGSIGVSTSSSCPWTASSTANWITISSGNSGTGNGTVNYTVSSGVGCGRSAYIDVNGQTFSITQSGGGSSALSVTTASLPNGTQNTAYAPTTVLASGGLTPYTWSAGGLPPGLSINSSTGVISGTPTTAGAYNATVTVTDNCSQQASGSYTVVIAPPAPTCTLTAGSKVVDYNSTLGFTWTITNGAANGTWSPAPGGTCSSFTGSNGGSCTTGNLTTPPPGANTFTLTVSNSGGSNNCSATVYDGCSGYRVWNQTGGTYDFLVAGTCYTGVGNGNEITNGTNQLNPGGTITRYRNGSSNCTKHVNESITYDNAMQVDSVYYGGNGNCQVYYNSSYNASDK